MLIPEVGDCGRGIGYSIAVLFSWLASLPPGGIASELSSFGFRALTELTNHADHC